LAQKDKKNNQGKGGQKKAQNLINPHTGKRDPDYTKKMQKKAGK